MLAQAGTNLDSVDLIGKLISSHFLTGKKSTVSVLGNTPLHTAYHTTHEKIAKMLIRYGANAKKRNLSGLIPSQLRG